MKKNVVKLNENTLKQIISESVKKILKEWDADEDNYYGGGLPDKFFDDEIPQNYGIGKEQIKQLYSIMDILVDIGNNVDGDTSLLYNAADAIEKYLKSMK